MKLSSFSNRICLVFCFFVMALLIDFSPVAAQEKLKIDNETVAVVPSPWKFATVDTKASLRGLHVLSEKEIWASGTGGTIVNSIDGGETWRVKIVPGAEELDFRDIHAIDDGTIVAMTSGTPARIYRSTNGGSRWKLCYESTDERVFLDALAFWDEQVGVVMGDPIGDSLFLLGTTDAGKSWKLFPQVPRTIAGEAGFAASGTNMIVTGEHKLMIALGGDVEGSSKQSSRVLVSEDNGKNWAAATVPIGRSPAGGIFSLCFANDKDGVAVGGDYKQPDAKTNNYAVTSDGGKTWTTPSPRQPPSGYRSCAATWINGREVNIVSVGPNGTDLSGDLGNKWHRVSNEGFHAINFTTDGKHGWASGGEGRLARWVGIPKSKPQQNSSR
jgi:photosystem II stability/assembly factor-like uncharacterized protein